MRLVIANKPIYKIYITTPLLTTTYYIVIDFRPNPEKIVKEFLNFFYEVPTKINFIHKKTEKHFTVSSYAKGHDGQRVWNLFLSEDTYLRYLSKMYKNN